MRGLYPDRSGCRGDRSRVRCVRWGLWRKEALSQVRAAETALGLRLPVGCFPSERVTVVLSCTLPSGTLR